MPTPAEKGAEPPPSATGDGRGARAWDTADSIQVPVAQRSVSGLRKPTARRVDARAKEEQPENSVFVADLDNLVGGDTVTRSSSRPVTPPDQRGDGKQDGMALDEDSDVDLEPEEPPAFEASEDLLGKSVPISIPLRPWALH